jgi:hypothetical protein
MQVIEEAKTKANSSSTYPTPFRCESYWIKACNIKDSSLCLECRENLYLKQAKS